MWRMHEKDCHCECDLCDEKSTYNRNNYNSQETSSTSVYGKLDAASRVEKSLDIHVHNDDAHPLYCVYSEDKKNIQTFATLKAECQEEGPTTDMYTQLNLILECEAMVKDAIEKTYQLDPQGFYYRLKKELGLE